MKKWFFIVAIVFFFFGSAAWMTRGFVRDWKEKLDQPALPEPQPATSFVLVKPPAASKQPQKVAASKEDVTVWNQTLPKEINLRVPFLSQAPKQNWDMPYQEACEEASAIMVDAFFRGRAASFLPDEGEKAILDLIAFNKTRFDGKSDLTTKEVASLLQERFGYEQVLVKTPARMEEVKAVVARGYPVIVPAYGKALGNPNFRRGGPLYHMLVIKGYLTDGRIIVNDPGTRKGADYLYDADVLFRAIHDWNGGDVQNGVKQMLVVIPNKKKKL